MKSKVKIVQLGHVPSAKEYMDKLEAVVLLAALIEYVRHPPIEEAIRTAVAPHVDVMEAILDEKSDSDVESSVLSTSTKLLNIIINGN